MPWAVVPAAPLTQRGNIVNLRRPNSQIGLGVAVPTASAKFQINASAGGFAVAGSFIGGSIGLGALAADPALIATQGQVYSKSVLGVLQLFYEASDGTVSQLTPGSASVVTLQDVYDDGNTIVATAARPVAFSNAVDATNLLTLTRTFAGAGSAASVSMGATTTGAGYSASMIAGSTGAAMSWSGGTSLFLESTDGSTSAVSGAATGRLRYNNAGAGSWQISTQGSAYVDLATGVDTLQAVYGAGNTIAATAVRPIAFSNAVDATNLLTLTRTFAGAGSGLSVSMGATTTGNGLDVTMTAGAAGLAALFSGASISCPGTGLNSERFGNGAVAGAATSIAIGFGASVALGATDRSVVVGESSGFTAAGGGVIVGGSGGTIAFTGITLVGLDSTVGGNDATAVGSDVSAGGASSVAVGTISSANSANSIAVGYSAAVDASATARSIVIGQGTNFTATGGGVIVGGAAAPTTVTGVVIVGLNATAAGGSAVAVGDGATASGSDSVALGFGSTASNGFAVAVGDSATASGASGVAVGGASSAAGTNSTALGTGASAGHLSAIALGAGASTTAASQLVIGADGVAITDAYIGNGVTNATPADVAIHATGGFGAGVAGALVRLAAGVSGDAATQGGDVRLSASLAGSGTTTTDVVYVTGAGTVGRVGIGAAPGAFVLDVAGDTRVQGKLTVTGVIDPTAVILSGGTDLYFESADGSTAAVSGAATGRLRYNNTTGTWQVSTQAGAYSSLSTAATSTLQQAYTNGGAGGGTILLTSAGGALALTNPAASAHAVMTLTQGTAGQNALTASGGNIDLSGGNVLVGSTFGIDTSAAGSLKIGVTTATSIDVGGVGVTALNLTATTTTITGDLTVNGTVTTINTTNLTVTDSLIYANDGAGSASAGIAWDRQATTNDAIFLWSEANSRFEIGLNDTTGGTVTPASLAIFSDVKLSSLLLAGAAITADAGLTVTATTAPLNLSATGAFAVNLQTSGVTRVEVKSDGPLELPSNTTAAVSSATKGALRYNNTTSSFQVSASGGAWTDLATGSGNAFVQGGNAFGALATLGTTDANALRFITNNTDRGRFLSTGELLIGASVQTGSEFVGIVQPAKTSGSPTAVLLTGGAHTTLAASTEATDVNLNLARTVQFSTGALATQRAVRVQAPTYAFVAASTITDAATLSVSGPPAAGANATITNPYALWVQTGVSKVAGFAAGVVTKTANYTLVADDFTIRADNPGGGTITMTLPAVAGVRGRIFVVKKVNAGGGAANRVTVAAAAGETIDGAASSNLNVQYSSLMVQAPDTGTDWMAI